MKKALKRVAASFMALTMVLSTSAVTFAAAGDDVEKVTLNKIIYDLTDVSKPAVAAVATDKVVNLNNKMVMIPIMQADLKKVVEATTATEFALPVFNDGTSDLTMTTVYKYTEAEWAAKLALTDTAAVLSTAITDPGSATNFATDKTKVPDLDYGDVIVAFDGESPANYYAFKISTKSGGSLDGEGIIENPVLNVVLPTNLDFTVDPLEVTTAATADANGRIVGSQIDSPNFAIINKSSAAVKVDFTLNVEGTTAADTEPDADDPTVVPTNDYLEFVASPDDIEGLDNIENKSKKIFMGAVGSEASIAAGRPTFDDPFKDTVYSYVPTVTENEVTTLSDAVASFVPAGDTLAEKIGADAVISFALAASTDTTPGGSLDGVVDTLAAGEKGFASFKLYGVMNSYADWDEEDLTLTGAYSITGLRTGTYTGLAGDAGAEPAIPSQFATKSPNMLLSGPTAPNAAMDLTMSGVNEFTFSLKHAAFNNFEFNLETAILPGVLTVKRAANDSYAFNAGTTIAASGNYTYNGTTGVLDLNDYFAKAGNKVAQDYLFTISNNTGVNLHKLKITLTN